MNFVKTVNLAGKTNLSLLCPLISQLDILLSIDTGAAHIAAAYKMPQVVIFGPVSPR